jgi:GDSL-like Lipase/Acylhydrolase family
VLVALGDSITNARGSWAERLAGALGMPWTKLAHDGAVTLDALHCARSLAGSYAIGAVHIGVNDVRAPSWALAEWEPRLRELVDLLQAACRRVVVCTLPLDLGRPRAAPKPALANEVIRSCGAVVAELADLRGWRFVSPDAVHLTAAGQAEVARRAAAALGGPLPPRARARPERVPAALARDLRRRWSEGTLFA